jgi:hypothetical protein
VLIFGGIVLFAVVLYACIGVWLWRRAKELFAELGRASERLDRALGDLEDQDRANSLPTETGGARRR